MLENVKRGWLTLLLSLAMMIAFVPMSMSTAYAAAGSEPPHTKNLTDNQDGTYTISLDVVGDSEKQPNNVNVIVIMDTSGSMDTSAGNTTRMAAAKNAVNNLANSLFSYNTSSAPNTVQMALVSFATTATAGQPTNSYNTFRNAVNALDPDGGTNWEDALHDAASVSFGDDDQTFVIFVSDGNPTFRNTQGGYERYYNDYYTDGWGRRQYGRIDDQAYHSAQYGNVYGNGQDGTEENVKRSYNEAVDDAKAIATAVGADHFFTIGAYGDVSRMQSLTTAAGAPASNYFSAANTTELQNALNEILAKIEMVGIGSVDVADGTTNQVKAESGEIAKLLEVDTSSFKYYRSGGSYGTNQEWADAPEATFKDGKVDWDLSELGVLENGVKYTVTFDCYPSQYTYDTIAKLKNGDITYDSLDSEVKKYIVDNGNGTYSLRTNTNATLSYDDTRDDAGQQTASYKNPDPVRTDAATMSVTKEWENELDARKVGSIDMTVLMDGDEFHEVTLSADDDPAWTEDPIYISPGIIKDGKVLSGAEGHDFTFAELGSEQYNWELVAPTVHPMLIDGTLTMLTLVDDAHPAPSGAATYTIDSKTYYSNGSSAASLDAYNYRRSNLNLKKVVTGEDKPTGDDRDTFPFTLKVNNGKAASGSASDTSSDYYVWFSIYDTVAGATVKDATVTGATPEDGNTGYYYAPSGATITVQMKDGWNLRFTNLPTETTYSFEEGTLSEGYAFNKAELTDGEDSTFKGAQTSTGTIENTNTSYEVTYTNDYQLTDLEITKKWEDANNQDGKRLTADELKAKLTLSPAVQGKEPTVVDNEDGTYTITYTGLPRFNNGKEVEYTVAEGAVEGYTTTGSPAKDHGTITNTHEPETTQVTITKVWNDSNDIGKIRPASINAQLKAGDTTKGDPVALNADNEWTYTWENLPKYAGGEEIVYTADETADPEGYDKTGPVKTIAQDETVTFTVTNTYNPTPVKVDPPVQKIITGNDDLYNKGDFTFTIEAVTEGAPMPAKTSITNVAANEVEGKTGFYEFGEITFTKPGTYTYKVTESGSVDGVTNDSAASTGKTLTFTVEDDGTGKLTVTPTTDQVQLSFTNVYDADGEASIVVSKEITGAAWPADKTLTLTIAGADGAPMPEDTTASLTAAGSVTFGPIAYGLSDAGKTYTYTITESSFGDGWTGTPEKVTATVKVTDNKDGTLSTDVTYTPTDAKFTNKYTATGKATLEATKAIGGAAWPAGKKLTLTLAGTESAPMPAEGGETVTLEKAGKATFGEIAYTEADAGKTYTYTISEDGFGDGWTGSGDITATVKVTDNGDGTLKTEVTYNPTSDTITNTYEAEGNAVLEVTKAIKGAAWPTGKKITFTLAGTGGTLPETKTVELTEAGKATFGAITYDESDAGKTYTYEITEDGFGTGWTGSPAKITATVEVTDKGDGTLTTKVTYDPANATITNTYKATGKAEIKVTKAITGAAWPTDKTLTLEVEGSDGAPMPENAEVELTKEGKADFGKIAFNESHAGKTYTYTITEDGFGTGWTGTPSSITAKVEVTDKGNGELETKVTYDPENATFTNAYKATGEAELAVDKAISGAAWPEGKTLTLKVEGSDGAPMPENAEVELTKEGKADFGKIAYTEADAGKTYTYTITEDGFGAGWTGTPSSITATIEVTDKGNGKLETTVKYDPENATFTNTYKAEGEAELKVTKAITGAAWPSDKTLTLTATGKDGAPEPENTTVKLTAAGEADFGKIELSEADAGKTYKYIISEDGFGDGWTGSGDVTATLVVTDKGDGTLTTKVTYDPANATITNTYKATGNAVLEASKVIGSAEWPAGKTITFTLSGEGGKLPETKTVELKKAGKATFGAITYDESDIGKTYTYTISEDGFGAGWTGSGDVTATVKVSDNGDGTLKTEVTYSPDNAAITNTYAASGEATLTVNKTLTGRDWKDGESYTFALFDKNGTKLEEKEVTSNGAVTFKTLKYTLADLIDADGNYAATAEYTYTIKETTELPGGVSNSGDITATVKLTNNGDGTIGTEVTYSNDAKIVNTYTANPVKAKITVDKKITGYKPEAEEVNGEFKMILTPVDGAPMPEGKDTLETTVTTENGGGSSFFEEIKYTKAGTYTYKVTEEAGTKAGMTYDTNEYTVTVEVTDDLEGKLVATVKYAETSADSDEEAQTSVKVTNDFQIKPIDVVLSVTKEIDDQSNSAEDATFTFVLKDADKGELQTKTVTTNGLTGGADFDPITFTKDGKYTFYIQESVSEEDAAKLGWTYDTNEYPVVVEISDNLTDAKLVKDGVTYDNDKTQLVVTNTYKAEPATVSDITVKKTIDDTSGSAYETTFTFTLTAGSNNVDGYDTPMPENNKASVTGEGEVTFAGIEFEKAGVYNYTVKEEASDDKGYIFDTAAYDVVITVVDEDGQLVASVDYGKDEETGEAKTKIDIVNTYDPEDAKAKLKATKIVKDKTGSAPNETFTFELVDPNGEVIETVTREMGGPVEFSEITFSKVGTYTYKIREVAGSTPGYTYDTAEYAVTIKVTDPDKDGVLKASVTGNDPQIENPYEVGPGIKSVTDQISITKKLSGRDLEADEFTFVLKQIDGDNVRTATNDENGVITFNSITFDKVGEYAFTVYEAQGDLEHVTYDSAVYTVVAKVTDPHNGESLEVNWTCEDGKKIVFNNEYKEPPKPTPEVDTGDTNDLAGMLGVMGASASGLLYMLFRRKREQE